MYLVTFLTSKDGIKVNSSKFVAVKLFQLPKKGRSSQFSMFRALLTKTWKRVFQNCVTSKEIVEHTG